MSSERVGSLTILTACLYAFTQYLQNGIWIFPFVLYKIGLFLAIILMFIADKRKLKITEWLALGWSFALVLSSKFFLQFFVREQHMRAFSRGLFVDVMLLLFCLLFLVWAVIVSLRIPNRTARGLGVFFAVALGGAFLMNLYIWAAIQLIGWLFCIFQERDRTPTHFNIITLFAFLYFSAWITGAYLGGNNILGNM